MGGMSENEEPLHQPLPLSPSSSPQTLDVAPQALGPGSAVSRTDLAQLDLATLATQINRAHRRCEAAARKSLQYALEAGALLSAAKTRVPHGVWLTWLAEHTAVSPRTRSCTCRPPVRGRPISRPKTKRLRIWGSASTSPWCARRRPGARPAPPQRGLIRSRRPPHRGARRRRSSSR